MQADYVLNYDVISMAREHNLYLLARIKAGPAVDQEKPRHPLNLSVVLDRSGSMGGNKLDYVKQATSFLLEHLGASDWFSLVTYDDAVTVTISPNAPVHKDALKATIAKITAGNSTNLSGGWLQGCQLVAEKRADGQTNRVLLLTDGLANRGVTDPKRLAALARQKREEGVSTTTIGVGMDFNEDLLVQMAAEGGGAFYFIDSPDRAPQIFTEELQSLLKVVGQNLTITLTCSEQIRMVRQLNAYPTSSQNGAISFRLGDLYADEVKTMLLELHIPAMSTLGLVEVARLRFEYDELGKDQVTHQQLELPIRVNVTAEADAQGQAPNTEVATMALLMRAARAREEAVHFADQGQFDQAKQVLTQIADEIQQQGLDDSELRAEHSMLREAAMDMELGETRYDDYSRKVSSSQSFTGGTRRMSTAESFALYSRLKSARRAVERSGKPPTAILWQQSRRDLTGDLMRIGRAPDNDIVAEDDSVSRNHCHLVHEGADWYLLDLGSKNSTFANGGRVDQRFRLSAGDVVTLGTVLFTFE